MREKRRNILTNRHCHRICSHATCWVSFIIFLLCQDLFVYIHTYIHTYIHRHTHMCVYVCMYTYIHTYMHTYTKITRARQQNPRSPLISMNIQSSPPSFVHNSPQPIKINGEWLMFSFLFFFIYNPNPQSTRSLSIYRYIHT